jgi:acyl transferase domain-containing protein
MAHGTSPSTADFENDDKLEPIAIIGASCRFPGEASSMMGLWEMIKNSRSAHGKVPADRFDVDAWYHPSPDRKGTVSLPYPARI